MDKLSSLMCLMCLPWLAMSSMACAPAEGTLEIFINRSPLGEEEPLESSLVSYLSIQVSGGGMSAEQSVFRFVSGGTSTVPAIEAGERRILTVEGLSDLSGYTISRGRSLPIEIKEGHQRLSLFVGRVERFSLTPEYGLSQSRFAHSAVLSEKGQLFVIGGAAEGTLSDLRGELGSFEVYNPTSGETGFYSCESSGQGSCLEHPRAGAAAVETDRGILILGGATSDGFPGQVELLDMGSMEMSPLEGVVAAQRANATVLKFADISVVVGGTSSEGEAVDTTELITSSGSIEKMSLPARRAAMAGAAAEGKGILFGGHDEQGTVSADVFVFDSSNREFARVPFDGNGREFASAVGLADGRIAILGGVDENGVVSDEVDLFFPDHGRICPVGQMLKARSHAAASLLPDGRILIAGGLVGSPPTIPTNEVEAVDVRYLEISDDCTLVQGQFISGRLANTRYRRYAATAVEMPNRTVVIVGGLNPDGEPIKEIEIYVPQTN